MKSRIKKSVEQKLKSKFGDSKNLSLQLLQKNVYILYMYIHIHNFFIIPNIFIGINVKVNFTFNIYPSDKESKRCLQHLNIIIICRKLASNPSLS